MKVNINIKVIVPVTVGIFLCFVPASLGEMAKSGPTPMACEAEVNLLTSLGSVKTPQALHLKVLEAKKFLTEKSEQLELARIARASKNASPKQVPALKNRLIALLEEKCVDKD